MTTYIAFFPHENSDTGDIRVCDSRTATPYLRVSPEAGIGIGSDYPVPTEYWHRLPKMLFSVAETEETYETVVRGVYEAGKSLKFNFLKLPDAVHINNVTGGLYNALLDSLSDYNPQ